VAVEVSARLATRPHLFAIVSWGAAATTWLAKSLNTHPEIFCFHAANVPLLKFEPGFRLDGVRYAALILRAAEGYKVGGDVHGFPRRDIPELKKTFGDGFSSAVLVRDLMARLRTQLALFNRPRNRNEPRFVEPIVAYIGGVAAATGVDLPDGDLDAIFFLHAVNLLNAVTEEREVGPIYRNEYVTTRPEALTGLVEHLGGGRMEADRRWVEETLALRRVKHERACPAHALGLAARRALEGRFAACLEALRGARLPARDSVGARWASRRGRRGGSPS
jgi:hypothetical protein